MFLLFINAVNSNFVVSKNVNESKYYMRIHSTVHNFNVFYLIFFQNKIVIHVTLK